MKQLLSKGKILVTYLSVFSVLAASILSVFTGVNIGVIAETGTPSYTVWDGPDSNPAAVTYGSVSDNIPEGEGTTDNPFMITNGDQLYRMVYEKGAPAGETAYYKLANDIYLNDISNFGDWDNTGFDFSSLKNWATGIDGEAHKFMGYFDGDGHTVYGMYAYGVHAGFIPVIGSGTTTIKNLKLDKFYVEGTSTATNGSGAGALIGRTTNNDTNCKAEIANCAITDGTVKGNYAAVIVGFLYNSPLTLKNTLVVDVNVEGVTHESGVYANGWGTKANVTSCMFIGINPLGTHSNSVNYYNGTTDVYTDTNFPKASIGTNDKAKTIQILSKAQLTGSAAAELDLDWDNWQVNESGYPTPKKEKIIGTGIGYEAENAIDKWNGKTAKNYAAGNGSATDPWIIETAEQFYKMVTTKSANEYYKIADGVEAFYFNDIEGKSHDQAMNYLVSDSALNYLPGENSFSGYFDGNGATIYGIKSVGSESSTLSVGLFPLVDKNATIKNITVRDSFFSVFAAAKDGIGGAGGIVGSFTQGGSATIRNSAVIGCKIYAEGQSAAAGIVANTAKDSNTTIKNCLVSDCHITSAHKDVKLAAIVADGSGTYKRVIEDCLALGTYPVGGASASYDVNNNKYTDVYTDAEASVAAVSKALEGYINTISADNVKGDAAKSALAGFDWEKQWKTGADYPVPRRFDAVTGAVGGVWSGFVADSFAKGDGTQNNPYIIDTPERFRYMLDHAAAGYYYALTEDIYLNDVTNSNWYEAANVNSWVTSEDVGAFEGRLNGNNHTVYGLYAKDVPSGTSAGLIPVVGSSSWIRNLKVDKSYLAGAAGSNIGAIAGSAESGAAKAMSIRGCEVKENVILNGGGNVGGVIGYVGATVIRIDNVAFKGNITGECAAKGGINAASDGDTTVRAAFSVGIQALGYTDVYSVTDVYDTTTLTEEQMKGDNAKTYMSALAWKENAWEVVAGDYPVIKGNVKPIDGVPGTVWSGDIANEFAGGKGTESEPWQIATGEQLYKMYMEKLGDDDVAPQDHFILTADILLNDVNSDLWAAKSGVNSWEGNTSKNAFRGTFDGDGHVIIGLCRNEPDTAIGNIALFPRVSDGAVIKRVGLSHAYISQTHTGKNNFTAGLVGQVVNWDDKTDNTIDDFTSGEYNGEKVPIISECFVDHNSYISGQYAGGIVCAVRGGVIVENCYFTGTLNAPNAKSAGCIIGDAWEAGSIVKNCFGASQSNDYFSAGNAFILYATELDHKYISMKGNYTFSLYGQYGVNKLRKVTDCYGETNHKIMSKSDDNPDGFDFENIWMVVEDGTPVLRAFNHDNMNTAEAYSCKNINAPKSTVVLQTGTSDITYEPLVGTIFSDLTLPTPTRDGYDFTGWYVYSDYQCLYDYGYYPPRNLTLYAGWKQNAVIQDFESYPNSMWDIDTDHWTYNRPGAKGGYKPDYTHGGSKSMHRLATEGEQDCLLNYEDTLTVGQTYTMTFWVTTDTPNSAATLSLIHNTWPDYLEPNVGVEPMVTAKDLTVGEWTKYTYNFTAKTQWVSLRTTGGASLYFDDFIIAPTGTLIENNGTVINLGTGTTSPDASPSTGDSVAPIVALVATIVACAVVMLVSRKGCVEVIEK